MYFADRWATRIGVTPVVIFVKRRVERADGRAGRGVVGVLFQASRPWIAAFLGTRSWVAGVLAVVQRFWLRWLAGPESPVWESGHVAPFCAFTEKERGNFLSTAEIRPLTTYQCGPLLSGRLAEPPHSTEGTETPMLVTSGSRLFVLPRASLGVAAPVKGLARQRERPSRR